MNNNVDAYMNIIQKAFPKLKKYHLFIIRHFLKGNDTHIPFEEDLSILSTTHPIIIPFDNEVTLNYRFYKEPPHDIIEPWFEEPYFEFNFKEDEYNEAFEHMVYLINHIPADTIIINIFPPESTKARTHINLKINATISMYCPAFKIYINNTNKIYLRRRTRND